MNKARPLPMSIERRPGHLLLDPLMHNGIKGDYAIKGYYDHIYTDRIDLADTRLANGPGFYYLKRQRLCYYCSNEYKVFEVLVEDPDEMYFSCINEDGVIYSAYEHKPILFKYVPDIEWMFG